MKNHERNNYKTRKIGRNARKKIEYNKQKEEEEQENESEKGSKMGKSYGEKQVTMKRRWERSEDKEQRKR